MAIQISGCTVIDNSRNITNANNMCVGVVTMTGSSGDIETPGTITAGGFDFPLNVISLSPANGATDVPPLNNEIVIIFDQAVGIATTGVIELRSGSADGAILQSLDIDRVRPTTNGIRIIPVDNRNRDPIVGDLPGNATVFPVIPTGFIKATGGDFVGLNTTGADSYSFTTREELGSPIEGGFLICCSSPTCWIVAPSTSEVSRNFYCRNDASAIAQQVSGCTGWFVPTVSQLQNPGYVCRTFWDSFSSAGYWSTTPTPNIGSTACIVCFNNGTATTFGMTSTLCVRAFRTVTY
jgi:hypothetical protein